MFWLDINFGCQNHYGVKEFVKNLTLLQRYKDLNVFCKCVKLILRIYLNSMQVVHGTFFLLLLV